MPAPSPITSITRLEVSLTVKVNGSAIKDTYAITTLSITHEVYRISFADISLVGDSIEAAEHPVSDSTDFDPGNEIEVTAGMGGGAEQSIFKGVIVKHSVEIDGGSTFTVKLSCKHKAIGMTFNKTEAEFSGKTDSDVLKTIAGNYSGFSCTVDATTPVQENIFQKLATDWDFILSRAEFYGHIVTLDGTGLNIGKPKLDASPVLRIAMGESILSFRAELSAEKQATAVAASAWDIKNQALLTKNAAEPGVNAQGSISAKKLSGALAQKQMSMNSATPMLPEELQAWADSSLLRMRMSAMKGQVSFIGSPLVKTGDMIQLEGVGEKFNGPAFVSAVTHVFEPGKWKTNVKFGLEAKYIHEKSNFAYNNATGQLPPIQGLHVATVKKIFEDPQSQYRVLVNIPSASETQTGFWARLSQFYASNGNGSFFYPEVGDEVIVGFLENDPRYPVILGSVYSNALKAPEEPADNTNKIKSLTTKSKMKISFDEEKIILKIETPAGNTITLDDDGKTVEIKDQNNNNVKMSSDGITISSDKDITLSANNITLSAKGKVSLTAKGDVVASGMNVTNTAQIGFTAKGATAELAGSGQTTVKGAIVMIN